MGIRFSDLWKWDGTIDRGPYALIGLVGFAIKHNLDRFVATLIFHRPWEVFNYWIAPTTALRISHLSGPDARMLGTLLILALPFIWVGVALTLRRLRAARLPVWLVFGFFLPVVNLAFFLALSILPSRHDGHLATAGASRARPWLDRPIPESELGAAAMAVLITLPFEIAAIVLGVQFLKNYGWSVFVALPFCHGLASVLLYSYPRPRSYASSLGVCIISVVFLGALILAVAFEGAVCLAMAAPIALLLACMGGSVGYLIQRRPGSSAEVPALLTMLVLFVPLLMGAEHADPIQVPLLVVRSSIEINAPPEQVWKNVVSFSELPPPQDWIFRTGVAYPIRARIAGQGAGAVRTCEFSTGAFVEPIEVWDEPRRLRFGVTSNPAPMEEWTPYRNVRPPHLRGFLVSRGGQFLLTPLPGGRTRLEGTTWYEHHMWPATYWRLWSDAIIHRIHMRVLRHIKRLAENSSSS